MRKKGEVEIQFAWLFTAILGGVILTFFIIIGLRLAAGNDIQIANELGNKLETTLSSTGASAGGGATFAFEKDRKVTFECELIDGTVMSRFFVEKANGDHPLPTTIIFSPQVINDGTIYSFTKEFVPGTKVATFNYLSAPNVIYVIQKDVEGRGEALFDAIFVNSSNKILKDGLLDVSKRNPQHVNYIMFDSDAFDLCTGSTGDFMGCKNSLQLHGAQNSILTIVLIDAMNEKFTAGGIKIATATQGTVDIVESGFYGKEMALGAAFSANGEMYACNMKKTLDLWLLHVELLQRRTAMMTIDGNLDEGDCSLVYTAITNPEGDGKLDLVITDLENIDPMVDNAVEFTTIYDFLENPGTTSVDELNLQLRLGAGGCPLVY